MSNIIGFNGGLFTTSYISAEDDFQIANNMVLSAIALGDSVVDSNLSKLGTILNLHANSSTIGTLTVGVLNSITTNITNISSINSINGGIVTFRAGTIGSFVSNSSTNGSLYSTNFKTNNATMGSLYTNDCNVSSLYSTNIEGDTIDISDAIFDTVEFTTGTVSNFTMETCTASSMYVDEIGIINGEADSFIIESSTIGTLTSDTIDVDELNVTDGTFDAVDITSGTVGKMIINSCTASSMTVGSLNILNGGLNLATNTTTNLTTINARITSGTANNFNITSSTIGSLMTDTIDVDTLSATDITADILDITSGTANSMTIGSCTIGPLTISKLTSSGSINIGNNPMTCGALTLSSIVSSGSINIGNNSMTSGALSISSLTCSGAINNGNNSMTTGTLTLTNLIATNQMTSGALSVSNLTSFGSISCGTNSMTSGAMSVSRLTSFGSISCGTNQMTSGAMSVSNLTSFGSISCGTNSMTSGALSVANLTSFGSMTSGALSVSNLTSTGTINNGTNSMTSGAMSVSNLTSFGSISCGTNSMTSGSLTIGGLLASGDINNGTNSITSGAVSITNLTSSGTIISGGGLSSGISASRRYPPANTTYTTTYLASSIYNFRVSATSLSTSYGVGLYSIQTYNTYNSLTTLPRLVDGDTSTYWQPVGLTASSTTDYNTNGTFSISSGTNSAYYILTTNGTACYGLWLKFFLPVPINLTGIQYQPGLLTNIPTKFYICGSNDNKTFDLLYTTPTNYSVTGVSATTVNTLPITTTGYYTIFMIIFNKLTGPVQSVSFGEYYLLGTEAGLISTQTTTYSKCFTVNCPPFDNIDVSASDDNNGASWYGLGRSIDSGVENYVQLAGYSGLAFKTALPANQPALIIHGSGNVGIGTNNPVGFQDAGANPLNVTTATDTGAGATAITNMGGYAFNYANSNRALTIFSESWNAFAPMINLINRASNAYPQSLAEIHMGNTAFNGGIRMLQIGGAINNMVMQFFMPGGNSVAPTDNINFNYAVPRMSITRVGLVGIGTTNPRNILDITTASGQNTSGMILGDGTYNTLIKHHTISGSDGGLVFYNNSPLTINNTTNTPNTPPRTFSFNTGTSNITVSFYSNFLSQNTSGSDLITSSIYFGGNSTYSCCMRAVQPNGFFSDGQRIDFCTTGGSNQAFVIPRLTIGNNGYVGINITNPGYPLDVYGYGERKSSSLMYFTSNTPNLQQKTSVSYIGIHAENIIFSEDSMMTPSDIRIKTNILSADTTVVLDKILQLPLKTYNYIDTVQDGNNKVYGMISQHVYQVFPEAITFTTKVVPSIYTLATNVSISDDGNNVIIDVNIPTSCVLKINDIVELIIENNDKKIKTSIISFTSSQLIVLKWENFDIMQKVFVYGHEVDDFHILNKDYLGVVCMGGIQELTKRNDVLSAKVVSLEEIVKEQTNKIEQLQQQMAIVLAQLSPSQ